MNELLFFIHICLLIFFLIFSLKLGKEALTIFVCTQTIFANLFVVKQMELFSLTVTCSDVYAVAAIFGMNLLQEYFGKKSAQKTINLSFVFLLLFLFVSKLHLLYHPALVDRTQASFKTIFENIPRIVFASLAVFFLVQWFDLVFYGFLKKKFKENSIIFRLGASSILSQLIDTLLFSFFGLYMIVENIVHVMIISFFVKLLTVVSCSIFMGLVSKFIKIEKKDEV